LKLNTEKSVNEIIKSSYKNKEYLSLPIITPTLKSGYIRFKLEKFKKIGFVMDIDLYTQGYNYNLSKRGRDSIKYIIEEIIFRDIENKDIKNKFNN